MRNKKTIGKNWNKKIAKTVDNSTFPAWYLFRETGINRDSTREKIPGIKYKGGIK